MRENSRACCKAPAAATATAGLPASPPPSFPVAQIPCGHKAPTVRIRRSEFSRFKLGNSTDRSPLPRFSTRSKFFFFYSDAFKARASGAREKHLFFLTGATPALRRILVARSSYRVRTGPHNLHFLFSNKISETRRTSLSRSRRARLFVFFFLFCLQEKRESEKRRPAEGLKYHRAGGCFTASGIADNCEKMGL